MKSFLTWIETEESPGLSEPQHKKGEKEMALDDVMDKKIKSIIEELAREGKGSQKEILASMERCLKKVGAGEEQKPTPQDQQAQGTDQQAQGMDQQAPQQDQGMQINPVAQGRVSGSL